VTRFSEIFACCSQGKPLANTHIRYEIAVPNKIFAFQVGSSRRPQRQQSLDLEIWVAPSPDNLLAAPTLEQGLKGSAGGKRPVKRG
jgi:hypothetical protein